MENTTGNLMHKLKSTHIGEYGQFLEENKEEMICSERPFREYFKSVVERNKLSLRDVFFEADIPEGYGYKLVYEEKHTHQRDTILRLCYGAHFTVEETQHALRLTSLPELYPRVERDGLLIIAFNTRPGDINEVSKLLQQYGHQMLRPCGTVE